MSDQRSDCFKRLTWRGKTRIFFVEDEILNYCFLQSRDPAKFDWGSIKYLKNTLNTEKEELVR